MKTVNLGCGNDFSEDVIGIDTYDYGQQHILDLEKDKLPFEDDSVDVIQAKHFIEHLRDVQNCMNEAWRVLRKGGEFDIRVPYGLWAGASKPVHYQMITPSWFDFFRKEKTKIYGYQEWEIRLLEMVDNDAEVHCIMTPKK